MPGSVPASRSASCVDLRRRLGARQLRQAEVEDLDPAVAGEEHVLGLQVAVDDALLVRGGEAARDLERVVERLARRERARREPVAQRLALEQLRDDVGRRRSCVPTS